MEFKSQKIKRILTTVAARHNLQPADIMARANFKHFVVARKEVIAQMRAEGMNSRAIATALERDHTTILFHVNPITRAKKAANHRLYRLRRKLLATEGASL